MAPKNGDGDGASAWTPPGLGRRQWGAALRRAVAEFREDRLTDQAAALTYYGVLALFPALVALVSIVGLLGQSTVHSLIANIQAIPATGQAKTIVLKTIRHLSQHKGSAGSAFLGALGLALWAASGSVGGLMRASNAVHEEPR